MNEITIFSNPQFGDIGVLEIDGKPYFPAVECAKILGYINPRDAVKRHTTGVIKHSVMTAGGAQEMNFISEGNLYRLVGHSKLPIAQAFEAWIYDMVAPSIRRHGMYISEKTALEIVETPEEFLARALVVAEETLQKREERLAALEAENIRLVAGYKGMEIQLDKSGEYYSIKRVAELNGIPWAALDWRKLKAESMKSEYGVQKVFASNYGRVNSYHIDIWKQVYPDLVYGAVTAPEPEKPVEIPMQAPKEKRFEIYPLKDGADMGKPLTFPYESEADIRENVNRLKELNPHLDFKVILREG